MTNQLTHTGSALAIVAATMTAVLVATPATAGVEGAPDHQAQVMLDPQTGRVEVKDTIELVGGGAVAFTLSPQFDITSLEVNGEAVIAGPRADGFTLNLGAEGHHRVVLGARATLAPYAGEHNDGVPVGVFLGPDGGFLGSGWLAQLPGKAVSYQIKVRTPPGQHAVLPGRLQETRATGTDTEVTFASDQPGESPVLISGPFNIRERTVGKIAVRTYFHETLADKADAYLTAAAGDIAYFSERIGEYPYSQFAIVSGPAPVGIAFGGLTYVNQRILALPFMLRTSLPHELLHSWWGGAVDIDIDSGNWAEGLTTYMVDGDDNFPGRTRPAIESRIEWLRNYAALSPPDDISLDSFRVKAHDRSQVVGYGKAAFVFHMLKNEVGGDAFERAIRRFFRENKFKKAGWAALERAFAAEAGYDLGPFFHQWVTRRGAPELKARATRTADGVRITLRQKNQGRGFFLRLPVDIETERGVERHEVMVKGAGQSVDLKTESRARAVHVDPDFDIFRHLDKSETPPILRDVTLAANATLIIPESSPELLAAMANLARVLLDRPVTALSPASGGPGSSLGDGPLMIGGTPAAIRAFLAQNGLPATPPGPLEAVGEAGAARAWTARDGTGRTILVVEADSADALETLGRVLPHYRRQSWVVFSGGQVSGRGVWAASGPGVLDIALDTP